MRDDRGWTPLHIASANGDAEMVAILLKYNAVPNQVDKNNKTPKDIALESKCSNSTDILEQFQAFAKQHIGHSQQASLKNKSLKDQQITAISSPNTKKLIDQIQKNQCQRANSFVVHGNQSETSE